MTISYELNKLKIISGDKLKDIFNQLYNDILTIDYVSEAELVKTLWDRYESVTSSLNGSVFEGILATIFYRSGILPLYLQAKLAFVPNVDFDFVAYSKECGPIILSAKTSLRERYKQADLEGMMLRQVYRRSKSYLITLHEQEAQNVNKKIQDGKVLGIDNVIVATDKSFDRLINTLKSYNLFCPEKREIVTSSRLINTL